MSHFVLGTAGHIDHGKSSLVQALTGRDPDRLREEKERGITIELGFADLDLGEGRTVSIVDVPGHERFVRHMVAGAGGIDAVLLVVAADDGVRPQTREHLHICRLLGIERGIVALSKEDVVEPELLEVVTLEVRELLSGSFLEGAEILPTSVRTGAGLDAVREALGRLFDAIPDRATGGVPRLPVDRSFVLKGFGSVVTGTLVSGSLQEGEEVEILPGGRKARVRGLQVHWKKVERATAGYRTAVNLQGVSTSEVPRGSTLTAPGALETTRRIWARVTLLEGAPRSLRRGGPVRFHQGTCERAARIRILREGDDGSLDTEIFLDEPTVLAPGDRFILRRPSPVDTVGGGVVRDIRPPRGAAARRERELLEVDDPVEALLVRLSRAGRRGTDPRALASSLGLTDAELESRVAEALGDGRIAATGGLLFDGEVLRRVEERILERLEAFHRDEPLRTGMSREALRSEVCPDLPRDAWREMVEQLTLAGRLRAAGERMSLPGHEVALTGDDKRLADDLERRLLEAGLDPPAADELTAGTDGARASRILDLLQEQGKLVRLRDGRWLHAGPLEGIYEKLRAHARESRTIDVGGFKQLAGVSRKNAIPLLEYLDAERTTRRVGNVREILNVPAGTKGSDR